MMSRKKIYFCLIGFILCFQQPSWGDETDLFNAWYSSTDPRALLILDLSWSMDFPLIGCPNQISTPCSNVPGADCQCSAFPLGCHYCVYYTNYDSSSDRYCQGYDGPYESTEWTPQTSYPCRTNAHTANSPVYGDSTCSPPYYRTSGPGHTRSCRRIDIAKQSILDILNDDKTNLALNTDDEKSLGVKLGYIKFGPTPAVLAKNIGTPYADIWNGINAESTFGGTYLVDSLDLAKRTHDAEQQSDPSTSCAHRFVILVTDGQDTYACFNSGGGRNPANDYKRRRATVTKAKELADAGYKVYVIGFGGDMLAGDRNTLNWTAYYGGTDNLSASNSGNTGAITPYSDPCSADMGNDPGSADLSGYAYWAESAGQIKFSMQSAMDSIRAARYSFSLASVPAHRLAGENFLYEASFMPARNDPFWTGNFRKYNLNSDGSLGTVAWNAGEILKNKPAANRNIFTFLEGIKSDFKCVPPGDWKKYLGLQTGTAACDLMDYFRGEPGKNPDGWKLGDIFHSNPITIGSPSPYFMDILSPDAFINFRENYRNRERIIVVGANDGQFRAFSAGSGDEKWSFIPPNLLPKLKFLAHSEHSGPLASHMYFVDGPVMVADVWLGSGTGVNKDPNDWRTLLVFSEGRGVRNSANTAADYLWSASPHCSENFQSYYDSAHPHHCGYWAFDLTDTSSANPVFKWRINPDSSQAPYLGEPWSKMAIGRVKIAGEEKWVGFIGGGYNEGDPDRGKGFFIVDLGNGNVLWSFTRGISDTRTTSSAMSHSIPAAPAIVDADNDGYVDTAYIGDLGGNVWRFKFCTKGDGDSCNTADWSGGRLFQADPGRPIYTTPSVTKALDSLWVFWGTGDKENPNGRGSQDYFFALKDNNRTSSYVKTQLQDIGASVFTPSYPGWFIALAGGEKVLSDSSVFAGMVTWTTYTPDFSARDVPCLEPGAARLYALALMPVVIGGITYEPGAGLFAATRGNVPGTRAVEIGSGIGQMPIYSQKPGGSGATDAFITASGVAGQDASIQASKTLGDSPFTQRLRVGAPAAQVIHWWDRRVQ